MLGISVTLGKPTARRGSSLAQNQTIRPSAVPLSIASATVQAIVRLPLAVAQLRTPNTDSVCSWATLNCLLAFLTQ